MKAAKLLRGTKLPEHKVALVRMAGKLITHFDNLSQSTFYLTELRADEEPSDPRLGVGSKGSQP